MGYYEELKKFLEQANTGNHTTQHYKSEYLNVKVKVGFGQGNSAKIPWISFLKEPNTTRHGIYPVYLYYKENDILILAYGISETIAPENNWEDISSKQTISEYFATNFSKKPYRYGSSYIYKVYDVNKLPSKDILETDLENIINIYTKQMVGVQYKTETTIAEHKESLSVVKFQSDISQSGLVFSDTLINRYIASLLTKPFVLLTGLSGSGKTKIAQSFARWISEDNSQYKIIPVGSDWTNREPLLGYPNGLDPDEYILPDSGALRLIIEASKEENQQKPFFLILDEMNLSHVERYFADFLSVMESDEEFMLYSGKLRRSSDGIDVPNKISWPQNLFVIGTVNIDETTYMFSPKVLDRANTIEFRVDDNHIKSFLEQPSKIVLSVLDGKGAAMAQHFLALSKDNRIEQDGIYTKTFVKFFSELKEIGAEFGYRTAIEMLLLIKKLNTIGEFSKEQSVDIALMQKLLPKLHGSKGKISKVLDALISLCLKEGISFTFGKRDEIKPEEILYPITFEKLVRMYRNASDNGYTSYAEA
jgi:5-methylcytosine-specific restriction protein B